MASLNPVVLRSDVAVTEHNFVGGTGPEAGAGGAQGDVPVEKPVGPAGRGPCPAVLLDPARPDCGAPAAPVDPGAGKGGAGQGGGQDGGAGEAGGDTGGGEEDGGSEGGG